MLISSPAEEVSFYKQHASHNDHSVSLWLYLICGFAILLFSNSLNFLLVSIADQETAIMKILRVFTYTSFILIALFLKEKLTVLKAISPFLLILLACAIMSVLWSLSPKDTIIRTYGLIGTTLMGAVLAACFKWKDFLKLSLYSYLLIILITYAVCIVLPNIGVHQGDEHSGAWRGAFGHKNIMGRMMVFGFVLLYFGQRFLLPTEKLMARGGMAGAFLLIVMSTSMTSILVIFAILVLDRLLPLLRAYKTIFLLSVFGLGVIVLVLMHVIDVQQIIESLFNQAGRDVTLTGRTEVWAVAIEQWLNHNAILGFGYGGFWETKAGNLSVYWGPSDYIPPHAHNGFIQVAIELGFMGLSLTILYFISCVRTVWRHVFLAPENIAYFPLIIFASGLLLNITEVNYFLNRNIVWVFFIYATVRAAIDIGSIAPVKKYAAPFEKL